MAGPRRVVIAGGGAAGTLVAVQLLRGGGPGLAVTVAEPRPVLGAGVAFGTPDPWHRLNVPAITMTGLPEDPDHFRAWAGVAPDAFPPRRVFGAYLAALLDEASRRSPAALEHRRARVTAVRDRAGALEVALADGATLPADAVVLATGNVRPRPPVALAALAASGSPRFVVEPWEPGALDAIPAGATVGIVGTGHTALDLAASLLRGRGVARVVAVSRHGELPRAHEEPWRPRPEPAFEVAAFAGWADKPAEVRRRYREHPLGWRQALDSMRPQHRELWLAMTEEERRVFVTRHRREWEVHRSRLAPEVARDVAGWRAEGRLEVLAAGLEAASVAAGGVRLRTTAGALDVSHLLLATGPDESPAASPLLASLVAAGLARPGSQDLGIDAHPYDFRVVAADGVAGRPLYALGPIVRGAVWESIAIPEIRAAAARIAEQVVADPGSA